MPYLFLLIGVIIGGVIFGWLKYKKQDTNRRSEIPLKKTGKRIIVYFDKCVIKTRDYFEGATSNTMPSRIDMLDSLYNPNQEMNKIKKSVSVIVFNWMDGSGQQIEFRSQPIYMSGESLRAYLENKRETILYVDPENFKRYYFDIEFLYGSAKAG